MFRSDIRSSNTLRRAAVYLASVGLAALCGLSSVAAEPHGSDKASDGTFTGIAMVTSDPNWFELFQRPETPKLVGKDSFAPGESGAIAILFSNAEPNNGRVRVECEITAFNPDGDPQSFPPGMCYDGPAYPPNTFYPSLLDLQFTIGDEDPFGLAGFEIILRDLNSGRSVQLEISFIQGQSE